MLGRIKESEEKDSGAEFKEKDVSKKTSVIASLGHVQINDKSTAASSSRLPKESKKRVVAAESDSEDDCGPPLPDHMKMKGRIQQQEDSSDNDDDDDDDDDDSIGPPLPPDLSEAVGDSEKLNTGAIERKSDEDEHQESEEEDYGDDDDVSKQLLPRTSIG